MADARFTETIKALRLDQLAAEIVDALTRAGCDAVLLKGATTARWLYDDGGERAYGDVDVLIDRAQAASVAEVLTPLGFRCVTGEAELPNLLYASNWMRRPGEFLDLHTSLPSADGLAPSHLWEVLAEHQETWTLAGTPVRVLDWQARAVVVVLHAIHHGPAGASPLEDLRRLLARLDHDDWTEVADLGRRLGVEEAMGAGLRLERTGRGIASMLGLPTPSTMGLVLKGDGVFNSAHGIDRIARAHRPVEALRLALSELFPRPRALRRISALANRDRWGLLAAYVQRPFVVVAKVPAGLRAYRAARSKIRHHESTG